MFEVKPLRWSFILSLPFIVAAIWAVFFLLAKYERGQLVAQLNRQMFRGSVEEATLAVRQMAGLTNPPLEPLVAAAASPSGSVAREAQFAIGDLLRRWQRQLAAGRNAKRIATQLFRLAELLDLNRDSFSISQYPWLTKTATKVTRLANRAPATSTPGLATHCESLLAFAGNPANSATRSVWHAAAVPSEATAPYAMDDRFSEANQLASTPVGSQAPDIVLGPPPKSALQSILPPGGADRHGDAPDDAAPTAVPRIAGIGWQGRWLSPVLKQHEAVAALPPTLDKQRGLDKQREESVPAATSDDPAQKPGELAAAAPTVDTRTLLARWLDAEPEAAALIEAELAERGLHSMPRDLVRQFLSDVVDERVKLVQKLIVRPRLDAKPWLTLLADDASAEVRLAAVSVMATSNDPELIDKAWQVALHDRDPRVAGLTARLRDRRASLQRR